MDIKKFLGYAAVAIVFSVVSFQFGVSKTSDVGMLGGSTKSSWTISDNLTVGGNSTFTGSLTFKESSANVSADRTLTAADSGKTFYLSGGAAAYTLSATTTPGTWFRFVIGGAITGNATVVSAGSVNAIEGTLLVAGAVVDCAAEDTITFVADGENVGDFFDIRTDGTNWILGASGALTASKLTCTAT